MINSKGEEVRCEYDGPNDCHKCDRTDCMIGMMSKCVVKVERVPELENKLNEMIK